MIALCECGKISEQYCSRCETTYYCSTECQRKDWAQHKQICIQSRKIVVPLSTRIIKHIKKNWNTFIGKFKVLANDTMYESPKDNYFMICAVTTIQDKQWTMILTMLRDYPNFVFVRTSNYYNGIVRNIYHDLGYYMIGCDSICLDGNPLKDAKYKCTISIDDVAKPYISVDWQTGEQTGITKI